MDFFKEIWIKLGDHGFINIVIIIFRQFYFGAILGALYLFVAPNMLIYAS